MQGSKSLWNSRLSFERGPFGELMFQELVKVLQYRLLVLQHHCMLTFGMKS